MEISKEQWAAIEEAMQSIFCDVTFSYQGFEIQVTRRLVSEAKAELLVYINGEIKGSWFTNKNDRPPIFSDVYCKRTVSKYKPVQQKRIEKIWGKRRVKTEYPDLYDKIEYFVPNFKKASVICRQYKKLKGLEVNKVNSTPFDEWLKDLN